MYTHSSSISSFLHPNSNLGFVHITKTQIQVQITCVNTPLKNIWGIIELPIPKVVVHSRSFESVFFFIPLMSLSLFLDLACSQPVSSLVYLNFGHEPKAKVMKQKKYTHNVQKIQPKFFACYTQKPHTYCVYIIVSKTPFKSGREGMGSPNYFNIL